MRQPIAITTFILPAVVLHRFVSLH